MPIPSGRWLTPARLRAVLDVGESTEAEWRRARRIAFFRQGRVVRYAPAAVWEFLARHTVNARGLPAGPGAAGPGTPDWGRIERLIADQVRAEVLGLKSEAVSPADGQEREAA